MQKYDSVYDSHYLNAFHMRQNFASNVRFGLQFEQVKLFTENLVLSINTIFSMKYLILLQASLIFSEFS